MIDLDIESENMEEQISVFKMKEIARAAIAEANYKAYLEKQMSKYTPQSEEDLEHFSLDIYYF